MKKELAEPIDKLKLIAEEEKHINTCTANSSTRTRTRIRAHYAEDGVHNYYNAAADGDGVDLDLDTNFNEEVEQDEQSEPQQEVSWRISTRIKTQHDVIKHGTSTSTKWRIEIPRVETQTSEECYNSSSTTKTVRKRKCDQLTQLISKKNKHNPSRSKSQSQSRLNIENRLKDLIAFKAKYGHCKVNKLRIEKYKSLVHWCNDVNKSRRKIIMNQKPLIQLSDHDIKRLTDMGFKWFSKRVSFKSRFEDLAAFKAEHGHCMAPKQGVGKYKSLGLWCYQMRSARKTMEKKKNKKARYNLSDEDIQRLTDMGFEWEPQRKCFKERVEDLVAFKAEHGPCNVFEHWVQHEEDHKKYISLRTWCYKVRSSRRNIKKNKTPKIKLSNDDVELLTGMGFPW